MSGTTVAAPAPRRTHHAPLSQVTTLADAFSHPEFMARIKQAAPKHMSPDRMLSTFILAVRKTPKLVKCDLMSFLGACIGLASVGLEPNTPLGQAYLIPFEEKKWNPKTRTRELVRVNVQVIFGYQGLLDLAYRSGQVRSIHADVAWRTDEFEFHYGTGAKLRHRPMGGERGEDELPAWAYMHAAMKGEAESFEVMPMSDVLKIRNATQAYSSALFAMEEAQKKGWKAPAAYTEAPWVRHFVPMARKTVFRAGSKWLPKSIELAAALAWDELQDRRNPDYGAIIDGSADVLDGGLTALGDESHDVGVDIGLDREREPVELRPRQSTTASAAPQQTVKMPAWIAYLVDEHGEEVGGEGFVDPVDFARSFVKLWQENADKPALIAANIEYINEAKKLSPAAATILLGVRDATPSAATPTPLLPLEQPGRIQGVEMPTNRRGVDWPAYIKAIRDSLQQVRRDQLTEWTTANIATILRAPDVHRLMVVKIVGEHAAALGAELPPDIRAAIQTAPAAAPDRDKQWADDIMLDIADAPVAALDSFLADEAIAKMLDRLRVERPELVASVDQAVAERRRADDEPPLDVDDEAP